MADNRLLKKILTKVEDLKEKRNISAKDTKTKASSETSKQFFIGLIWTGFVIFFLTRYNLFGFETLINIVKTALTSIFGNQGHILWIPGITKAGFIYLFSLFIVGFVIYLNLLVIIPLLFLFSSRNLPQENMINVLKFQAIWLFIIFLIPLLIGLGFTSSTNIDPSVDFEESVGETKETTTSIWKDIACSFSYKCQLEKQNTVDTTSTNRQNFKLSLIYNSYRNSFKYEDIVTSNSTELKFKYEILSLNDAIILNRIDCYKNSVSDANKIYSENLNKQINTYDKTEEESLKCLFNSITSQDIKDNQIRIIPVLTYTINTQLRHEIPIYKTNCNTLKIEELEKDKFENTNNALKVKPVHYSKMPITIGENCEEEEKHEFFYTVTKNTDISLGKLKQIEITNYTISPLFSVQNTDLQSSVLINEKNEEAYLNLELLLNKDMVIREFSKERNTISVQTTLEKRDTLTINVIGEDINPPSSNSEPEEIMIAMD